MKRVLSRAKAALLIWALGLPLFAQNAVTITNNSGDETTGSFEAGVTFLNSVGGGNLVSTLSVGSAASNVTLSQPMPVASQSVTLQPSTGLVPGLQIFGQTGAPASLVFQNNFSLGPNVTLLLHGAGSNLGAGLTAGSLAINPGSGTEFFAGVGSDINTSGGSLLTASSGGNDFLTVTNAINMDSAGAEFFGGAGGSVTDTGGSNDTGGSGGSATASAATWNLSGSTSTLEGGTGGNVFDATGGTGGQGGGAGVSINNLQITNNGAFTLQAALGGEGSTGGAGGAAAVTAGSVTMSASTMSGTAGAGGTGVLTGGVGGAASFHWNSLDETQGTDIGVIGGAGGTGSQLGGQGGNALAVGVSLIESGSSSNFNETGGAGGNLTALGGGANSSGNGGNAGMTISTIQLTAGTGMDLSGGSGGSLSVSQGTGGNGGNASVSIGTLDIEGQSGMNLSGGSGGNGGISGNGGTALVIANAVTLDGGSHLTLAGGNAGTSTLGTAGSAGSVGVGFQTAFVGANSSLNLLSGVATSGPAGTVVATIADLTGSGSIEETGSGSVLQVGTGSFSGTISGTESLIQNASSGALTLSGNNSYSGGTNVSGEILAVDTGGSLGTGTVFVQTSKNLQYLNLASARFTSISNSGLVQFFNQSTAGNALVTDNGTVDFDDSSSAGAATFILNGSALVDFSSAAQGGTADFIMNTGSILDISNSTAGVVTVGSISGSGAVSLGSEGLAVGVNNLSTTFSGTISDASLGGSLMKQGTGILALSQANSYQGGTLVQQGQLEVGDANALGSGSVSVTGGTLSSMGAAVSLNVDGNYRQGAGGTLQIGLYGANVTGVDSLSVNGSAQLGGTLQLVPGAAYTGMAIGQGVVLLTAGTGITGTFQNVQESFPDMRLLPIYSPTIFEVESIDLSFAAASRTPNEKAIGADLDSIYLSPGVQHLMVLLGPQSDAVLRSAYDQLSPESFSVLFQSAFEGAQLQASEVDDRLAELRETSQAPTPPPLRRRRASSDSPLFAGNLSVADEMAMIVHPSGEGDGPSPWGGFFSGNGGMFTVGDTQNAAGFKATSYGLSAAGADYQVSNQLALGLLVGYGESDVTLNAGGSVTETGGQLGFYGTWHPSQAYVNALVEGALNHYSSERESFEGDAGGKTQGLEFSARLGAGYDWKGGNWTLGPLAAVQWTRLSIDGFTEQGPVASLTVPSQGQSSLMSQLGMHAQWRLNLGGIQIQPGAKISWEHEFSYQGGSVQAGFGQGDSFTVEGPAVGQDGFLTRGSLDILFSKQLTVSLGYQGELARTNLTSTQFDAGMKFGF